MNKISSLSLCIVLLMSLVGCHRKPASDANGNNFFQYARFIQADSVGPDEVLVDIINPWDSTQMMARYQLVNKQPDTAVAPDGVIHLNLPLNRLVVFSSVHAALLCELGYADAIVGLADAQYIKTPELLERLADGRITDVGPSTDVSFEKILALKPDALFISPFQNAGHGALEKSGIPVVECADYMETSPLGRAEWSKFYAMLVQGISPDNSLMFNDVAQRYNTLRSRWANSSEKPRVITELQQHGKWMVPGGRSFVAQMIADAGAIYPFADNPSPGSLQLSYEKVYKASENCDFWLLKSLTDITLADIEKNVKFNTGIWAYKHGGVYNANTTATPFYEQTPFHPDLLLADYVTIFHHTGDSLRYFAPVR